MTSQLDPTLSSDELSLLDYIERQPGSSIASLATFRFRDKGAGREMIDDLERRGYVRFGPGCQKECYPTGQAKLVLSFAR